MPKGMARPLIQERGSRHFETPMLDPGAPPIGILGTGDFSRSLANRLVTCGYRVVVGSRIPKRSVCLFPADAEVTSQIEAASQADLVFIAVYPEHYSTLVELRPVLAGKVLVDVSNGLEIKRHGPSNAEQLADLFPDSFVVKGFNVISAWTLQTGPLDGSRQVFVCGDSSQAKASVTQLCHKMGFTPVDMGPLSSSVEVENIPTLSLSSWSIPLFCSLSLFVFFYLYNFIRDVLQPYIMTGKSLFYKMPIDTVNVTLPCVALVIAGTGLRTPGCVPHSSSCGWGTKYRRFPACLDRWLIQRKQFGLCSFLCAVLHAIYSLCLPMRKSARYKLLNAAFKQVKEGMEDAWIDEEVWRMELYVSVGIMALGLLSLLAVTSLPSVANSINWREFSFIQSTLGYCALSAATTHTLLYGWDRAFSPSHYPFHLPPTFVLVLIPSIVVLLGRLVVLLPCVGTRLRRIRRGWEENRHIRFTLPSNGSCNGPEDISDV
ncbi:LOW QUALITY PROTEIN: metalloreductase STEAP3-like [Lampetra planeri]